MSLWIQRRDKNGRLYYISIGVFPLVLMIPLSLLMFLVLSAPVGSMLSFLALVGLGFFLFAVAKTSVFRQGCLVSFGSAKMGPGMRTAYRTGWLLMVIGATLTLFAVWFASRLQAGL